MENILTAKEWLEKEGIYRNVAQGIDIGIIVERGIINSELMERYANYKTKMLEAEILTFRLGFIRRWSYLIPELEKEFDSHFNIKKEMQGKINE